MKFRRTALRWPHLTALVHAVLSVVPVLSVVLIAPVLLIARVVRVVLGVVAVLEWGSRCGASSCLATDHKCVPPGQAYTR